MSAFGDKEEPTEIEAIKLLYQSLEKGYNSMPLDLPGTLFHKSMKVRILYIYELCVCVYYMKLMTVIDRDIVQFGIPHELEKNVQFGILGTTRVRYYLTYIG